MNFIFALFVLLASPNELQIFFYNGKTLTELDTIMMPNVGNVTFQFLINSTYELRSASVDSSGASLCLAGKYLVKRLTFSEKLFRRKSTTLAKSSATVGRWYVVKWETTLRVGSKQHTVYLKTRSGKIYKKHFTVNVEGNKKQEKPQGENR